MGKPTGFMDFSRQDPSKRPVAERLRDYAELEIALAPEEIHHQAARCMDCGVPHCHDYGCPLQNRIPDWNDLVYRGQWRKALDWLHATNNFPEITGRICPAPCETSCTLAINREAVCIRHIEYQIAERGWEEGWIQPEIPEIRTGRQVAVVGSGPCGLSAAQQLARQGHKVTVFEKMDRPGGLLRYGIPDFKLDKKVIDRRIGQMQAEGVLFETGVEAGCDLSVKYLQRTFDALLVSIGAGEPRDLSLPGRNRKGIHFAMDFLTQQNRQVAGDAVPAAEKIEVRGKAVVVLGGGDTGADCVGTSLRQGARQVIQIEILPKPPGERASKNPWPTWPNVLRTSSSHEEGCERQWGWKTTEFLGSDGRVQAIRCIQVGNPDAEGRFPEIPGTEREFPADLVLLAAGYLHAEHGPLVTGSELDLDSRGNVRVNSGFQTSVPGIFAAGDTVTGASLVVRVMYQGRMAAAAIDRYLSRKP